MRTLRSLSLTALLLAPLTPLAEAQPADWRFADPGAHLIGGLEVHGLLNSPLVKGALDQVAEKMGTAGPVIQMTLGTLGGISQVYFSITGRQDDAEALLMVKGTLDDAVARAFLQGAVGGSNGTQPKPQQPKMDMARVDATTILMGSPSQLTAALRRIQRPASAVPNPLVAAPRPWPLGMTSGSAARCPTFPPWP